MINLPSYNLKKSIKILKRAFANIFSIRNHSFKGRFWFANKDCNTQLKDMKLTIFNVLIGPEWIFQDKKAYSEVFAS